jgi:hypothetical protein
MGDVAAVALVREEASPWNAVRVVVRTDLLLENVQGVHPAFDVILQPVDPGVGELLGMASGIV